MTTPTNNGTNVKDVQTFSKYCLVPLPEGQPKIPLREGTTEVGRRTLTDFLQVTSQSNPKKMSVSRHQINLAVKGERITLTSVGLNAISLTIKGETFNPTKGRDYPINIGDVFTLCGQHFPFQIVPANDAKPIKVEKSEDYNKIRTGILAIPVNGNSSGPRSNYPSNWMFNPYFPGSGSQVVKKNPESGLPGIQAIGYSVQVYRRDKGTRMTGTITNYRPQSNQYEVTFGLDRKTAWEFESSIFVLPMNKKSLTESQKRKRRDSNSEDSSSSDDSDSDSSDSAPRVRKDRSARRGRKTVSYFEWPSDSSSDDDEPAYSLSSSSSGVVKKQKKNKNKTNWTAVQKLLTSSGKKTAILFSDICLKHYVPNWHMERPSRVTQVMEGLKTLQNHYPDHMEFVTDIDPVDRKLLSSVHDENYISKMETQAPETDDPRHATQFSMNDERGAEDCDTFMSHFSFNAALTAAGAVCKAVDLVMAGKYRNAFCCVRPPGHHCGIKGHTAEASSQGYCILNNIAIGAHYCIKSHNLSKVAVVDFDVHHGNGTEEILQGHDEFLFISIHVGEIYPGTGTDTTSRASNVLNIALQPDDGSDIFRRAFDTKILPRLEEWKPDILLLSSGFDGHKRDPTDDGLRLEEADFAYITDKMMELADRICGGKIVSVLEGGYHLPSLRKSAKEHVISLMKKVPSEMIVTSKSLVSTTTTVTTTTTTSVDTTTAQPPPPPAPTQSLDIVT